MKLRNIFLIMGLAFQSISAAPIVSSVSGEFTDQAQITITGSDFGTGPSVLVFDNFEGGAEGEVIPLTSPTIGEWTAYGQQKGRPKYHSYSRSGDRSMLIRDFSQDDAGTNMLAQFLKTFPTGVTEAYLSFAVGLPNGYFSGSSIPFEFPRQSSWKFAWFFDGPRGYGADGMYDICLPTHWDKATFGLLGNDGIVVYRLGSDWWSWKGFNRISIWLRADTQDPAGKNGTITWQVVSQEKGVHTQIFNDRPVFIPGKSLQFDNMTIPGWWGNGDRTNFEAVYDDIYLAVGPGAAARVEIGNSENYADATEIVIAPTTSWENGEIKAILQQGQLANFKEAYLFVTDMDNGRNAKGYPLCTDCPKPPGDFN